jgi:hypothetical protein
MTVEPWSFGVSPLPEVVELAEVLRDLTSTVLSLERAPDELRPLIGVLRTAQQRLAGEMPGNLAPRIGSDAHDDQRVYVDHSRDVGTYNPCFPVYEFSCADDEGLGSVEFPLCYEGPPGLVHGGFLAVFFDCVLQQLNCDLGLTGKTADLSLQYRRPTPLLTPLAVHASRTIDDNGIRSTAELRRDEVVLCRATMTAAVGDRSKLPAVSPRRAS